MTSPVSGVAASVVSVSGGVSGYVQTRWLAGLTPSLAGLWGAKCCMETTTPRRRSQGGRSGSGGTICGTKPRMRTSCIPGT